MKDSNTPQDKSNDRIGFTIADHEMIRKRYLKNLKMRFSEMKSNSIIVFQGGKKTPLYDTDMFYYYFEQESNFFYLTGVMIPNMILVIDARDETCLLFYQPEHEKLRVFMKIPSCEEIKAQYGIETKLMSGLNTFIQNRNMEKIYIMDGLNANSDLPVLSSQLNFKGELSYLNQRVSHNKYIYMVLCEMRLFKLDCEKEILRTTAKMSCEAICELIKAMRPGLNERDMENIYLQYLRSKYYLRSYGFNCICASGKNSATLHYDHNNKTINDGDLFLADLGARYSLYTSDTTITIPVNGKFTQKQKEIYDIVLNANRTSMKSIKIGTTTMKELNNIAFRAIVEGLQKVGILKKDKSIDEMLAKGMAKVFMPHSLGHELGLDCHDVGRNVSYRSLGILENGMCITIEPGIYFIDKLLDQTLQDHEKSKYIDNSVLETYRGFGGIRIEDTIFINENDIENLMVGIPRTTEEIENFMKK